MLIVDLSLAVICFTSNGDYQCYPALVGKDTIPGEYSLTVRLTEQAGYGGDVLQFDETDKAWYAIHRVWTLKPKERRVSRLASHIVTDRQNITNGCINIDPVVYEKLKDCCSTEQLIIRK